MFVAFITATIIVWVVATNAVVLLVLYKAPKLRTVPNILVGNLAFSDLMIGLLILPLSAWYTVTNRWTFGKVMCELWLVSDILICTVSIWNLAIIGLDRYWAITSPVQYIKKRTFRVAVKMIVGVYVISAVISIPPYLGWKYVSESGNYVRRHNATDRFDCVHFDDQPAFSIVSATGSFWVPLILMFFFYYNIFEAYKAFTARRHFRHKVEKVIQHRIETTAIQAKFSNYNSIAAYASDEDDEGIEMDDDKLNASTTRSISQGSDQRAVHVEVEIIKPADTTKEEMIVKSSVQDAAVDGCLTRSSTLKIPTKIGRHSRIAYRRSRSVGTRIGIPGSDSEKPTIDACFKFKESMSISAAKKESTHSTCRSLLEFGKGKLVRRARKDKIPKISSAKEKRGIKVLGIILGVFAICWIPFFSIYLVDALCIYCHIDPSVYNVVLWLGYINSTLNPIVYTVFNHEYQIALRKLIRGQLSSTTVFK